MKTSLRTLAEFAASIHAEDLPQEVLRAASERVLDNISVGVAAADHELVSRIVERYQTLGGTGQLASVWGKNCKNSLLTAVFINALMCHVLESDDVHTKSKAHIGAVVIPVAWALAETLGRSGKELLAAVVAGYEVEARIAMAFNVKDHRKLGWHVTATAGVFGAAAACGNLMGLDADTMVSCLGLAGAQSFGTWAFLGDGTNSKILNPARAAVSGCEAAILASAGMTGPEGILEGEDGGLLRMMTNRACPEFLTAGLGTTWEICSVDNKTYPCCRSTHCAIDSVLAIRAQEKIDCDQIEKIVIETYQIGVQQCAQSEASLNPRSDVEARFSTPYCVAAALLRGKITFDEFDPQTIADPKIRELMKRVEVRAESRYTDAYPEHWGCCTTIYCEDGTKWEMEVPDASGSVYNPLTVEQAREKAVNMMSSVCSDDAADIVDKLLHLDEYIQLPIL